MSSVREAKDGWDVEDWLLPLLFVVTLACGIVLVATGLSTTTGWILIVVAVFLVLLCLPF